MVNEITSQGASIRELKGGDMITLYSFEDRDGVEDTFITLDADEAVLYAKTKALNCIANTFNLEDTDSERIIDFAD